MNGIWKVMTTDEELKVIVFPSPFVLHYINVLNHYGFSSLEVSKGLFLVRIAPDFRPVDFSLTDFPTVDLDLSLQESYPPDDLGLSLLINPLH